MSEDDNRLIRSDIDPVLDKLYERQDKIQFAIQALEFVERNLEDSPTRNTVQECLKKIEEESDMIERDRRQLMKFTENNNDTERIRNDNKE